MSCVGGNDCSWVVLSLHNELRTTELKLGTTWSRETPQMPTFTGVLQPDKSLAAMSRSGLVKILIPVSLFAL